MGQEGVGVGFEPGAQGLLSRLWGSGFLPSKYQGVKFRGVGDPVLFLGNPPGVDEKSRRRQLDDLAKLNQAQLDAIRKETIEARWERHAAMARRTWKWADEMSAAKSRPVRSLECSGFILSLLLQSICRSSESTNLHSF